MIVDFHTHTFPKDISERVLEKLSISGNTRYFHKGNKQSLAETMIASGIDYSVNLPVATRVDQVESINDNMIRACELDTPLGIINFGCMHPDYDNVKGELSRLKAAGIKGIKIHPPFQKTDIDDIKYYKILDEASNRDMIVVAHCGIDASFPSRNFATPQMLLKIIDEVKPSKFVMAHLGGRNAWNEVEQYLVGVNAWFDTAYSLGRHYMRDDATDEITYNLNSESFVKLVRKLGTDRVLFATDSPWAPVGEYVSFVKDCCLTDVEKEKILHENAEYLLWNK